jgi:hypothetical protein
VIRAGDHLELTSTDGTTALTLPEIRLGIDIAGARVFGTVPGSGTTLVTLSSANGCIYLRQARPASDGRFQADFSYDTDIRSDDSVTVRYTTAAGHELQSRRIVQAMRLPLIIKKKLAS